MDTREKNIIGVITARTTCKPYGMLKLRQSKNRTKQHFICPEKAVP